jgi:hypothetical protein
MHLLDSENFNLVLKALACHPPIAGSWRQPVPKALLAGNELSLVRASPADLKQDRLCTPGHRHHWHQRQHPP